MIRQRGYSLIELSITVALIGGLTAAVLVAYNRYTASARVEQTRQQAEQLLEIITPRVRAGLPVDVPSLADDGAVPADWVRGTGASRTLVNAYRTALTPTRATLPVVPATQYPQVAVAGLEAGACIDLAIAVAAGADVLTVTSSGTTVLKRTGSASNVAFSAATARTACAATGNTLAWGRRA